uniref:Thioredoxin n=1 Tax=Helicosporidium sp. subsp. Simulium jonesii TaxID=145475 RepID=Q5YBB1_HELSJ|nr:thioredoxin H [Helicosporidium sp. ex Simulium jonesi]
MGGAVIQVTNKTEFDSHLSTAASKGKLVVVDFTATWCGPCKMIAPFFAKLSGEYPDVVFLKVDVDEVEAVAAEHGITAMPTFLFFKDGKQVDSLTGANQERLRAMLTQHAQS